MSAEFIVMVKRQTRHTKLIRIGDDHLTEVEFLPPLPLKDDELESSEYWIAAPWNKTWCQTHWFPILN
jgi:hypothetical protein